MPGPLIPLPSSVWKPMDVHGSAVGIQAVQVVSADRETVEVRRIGGLDASDFTTRKWETPLFLELYKPVKNHEGPAAKRAIRTRWERLLDEGVW